MASYVSLFSVLRLYGDVYPCPPGVGLTDAGQNSHVTFCSVLSTAYVRVLSVVRLPADVYPCPPGTHLTDAGKNGHSTFCSVLSGSYVRVLRGCALMSSHAHLEHALPM